VRVWIALVAVATVGLFLDGDAAAKKKPKGKPPAAASKPAKGGGFAPVADTPAPVADPPPAAAAPRPVPSRPAPVASAPAPKSGREVVERESKIEFDERAIQGQTASGAIYLFQRGESEFRSMIQVPDSFRERTVKQILPDAPKP
jgi:hypothetical protein